MAQRRTARLIAGIVILAGAALLFGALLSPWYTLELSENGASAGANFYLGSPSTNGTVRPFCSGLPNGSSCSPWTSYSADNASNVGALASTTYSLVILAGILGIAGGLLGVFASRWPKWGVVGIGLATVALIVALAAPGLYAASQTSAWSKDLPGEPGMGPWSSFFGSNSTTIGNNTTSETWGPSTGWYLPLGGFVLLLGGVVLLARNRRDPPPPNVIAPPAVVSTSVPPPPPGPPPPMLP